MRKATPVSDDALPRHVDARPAESASHAVTAIAAGSETVDGAGAGAHVGDAGGEARRVLATPSTTTEFTASARDTEGPGAVPNAPGGPDGGANDVPAVAVPPTHEMCASNLQVLIAHVDDTAGFLGGNHVDPGRYVRRLKAVDADRKTLVNVVDGVAPRDAVAIATFIVEHWWGARGLVVGSRTLARGFHEWPITAMAVDADEQLRNTLVFGGQGLKQLLSLERVGEPLQRVVDHLLQWMQDELGEQCSLFAVHVFRQSRMTLRSSVYGPHQDTWDCPLVLFTAVVKLTPDVLGEPPSRMRVFGADLDFAYGQRAGACGLFLSKMWHESLRPLSEREHLKATFFFTRSDA